MARVSVVCAVLVVVLAAAHRSEFLFLPVSSAMRVRYDPVRGRVRSESALLLAHFYAELPLPSDIGGGGLRAVRAAVRRPHGAVYGLLRAKEYGAAVASAVFAVEGAADAGAAREAASRLAGRALGAFGAYNTSAFDPVGQALVDGGSGGEGWYLAEVDGDGTFRGDWAPAGSVLRAAHPVRGGRSSEERAAAYLERSLAGLRAEWGVTGDAPCDVIEQRVDIDYAGRVLRYREVAAVYAGELGVGYPRAGDDHARLLTYLTSCGTDVATGDEVCKFTRHRSDGGNGQVVTTPSLRRTRPKGSLIQELDGPDAGGANYTLRVNALFMNASCAGCDIYYVYDRPAGVYVSAGDLARMEREGVGVASGATGPLVLRRRGGRLADTFAVRFHAAPGVGALAVHVPLVFQRCAAPCGERFDLGDMLARNAANASVFDLQDGASTSAVLFGCTDTGVDQVYAPHCASQVRVAAYPAPQPGSATAVVAGLAAYTVALAAVVVVVAVRAARQ